MDNNTPKNVTFTSTEIREWKESLRGKRGTLLHDEPNRKTRRQSELTKPIHNNRKKTSARIGNKLYVKMSRFYMAVTDKRLRAKNYVHE